MPPTFLFLGDGVYLNLAEVVRVEFWSPLNTEDKRATVTTTAVSDDDSTLYFEGEAAETLRKALKRMEWAL